MIRNHLYRLLHYSSFTKLIKMGLLSSFAPLVSSFHPDICQLMEKYYFLYSLLNCVFWESVKKSCQTANILRSTCSQTRSSIFCCYQVYKSFSETSEVHNGKRVNSIASDKWRTVPTPHHLPEALPMTDQAGRPYQAGYQNHCII